jgi:hypothetical protein
MIIFEGTPLQFFYLDLDSSEHVEFLSGNIDGCKPVVMVDIHYSLGFWFGFK